MALDYKALQAMAAVRPPAAESYCPECGRPWRDPAPASPHAPTPFPWRAVLLAAVGLALALTFGLRVASADRAEAEMRREQAVLRACVDGAGPGSSCSSTATREARFQVADSLADLEVAVRLLRGHALSATALGLLALAVGLGALARWHPQAKPRRRASSTVTIVWRVGEVLLALVCLHLLALYLDHVALQLSLGVPLTRPLLDRAADDALVVISLSFGV